jgi:hypothetical protein
MQSQYPFLERRNTKQFQVVASFTSAEPQFSKLSKAEQRFICDIAGCLVTLISSLMVASDEVAQAVDKVASTSELLLALVSSDATPSELVDDALACLLLVSEDNVQLADIIQHSERGLGNLMKLRLSEDAKGVLACGVLHNLFSLLDWHDNSSGGALATDALLVSRLSKALRDASDANINGKSGADEVDGTNGVNGTHSVDHRWSQVAEVTQLALEILASIGTSIQESMEKGTKVEEEEWDGIKDVEEMDEDERADAEEDLEVDEDEEMAEDEMEADMHLVTGQDIDNAEDGSIDDLPTLKGLLQIAIPQILQLAKQPTDSDDKREIRNHALSALSNIAWSVSCIELSAGHNAGIRTAWTPVGKEIWNAIVGPILAADTADIDLATHVTSLAWAIARSLHADTPLLDGQHRRFVSLYQATKGLADAVENTDGGSAVDSPDPLQSLGVKCIGVLGQLALDPAPVALNREIGVFLVTVLSGLPETPAADAVEALNQLFDIYGDENAAYDKEVFWKDDFLKHLEEILPKVRAMKKTIDKRAMSEMRERADEALQNLVRFIGYKTKHKPQG